MVDLIKWHDKRIIIEGEAIHTLGSIDITATLFNFPEGKPEWQLVWRFFTPQQTLLSTGFSGGLTTQKEAFAAAEAIFLGEIAKSEALKNIRESQGWKSLH